MQAYKLKGTIDSAGNLIVAEPVNMPPGDVEIILLQTVDKVASSKFSVAESHPAETPKRKFESNVKAFQGLFDENTTPEPPDFDDPDKQAKWEYLKEKHNL
ncbi:hypothetical protein [Kamptonema sp. UHCC 0994]|uniref:hypothetical protein n=1 Tax=Kamptonema sp. UHCC 0994 TaxID=3031329 RepID=UPI0023B9734C|nr:hypothetical protein [Kamptonema sp. UHCC 0994]MDF0554074.1 hypothetical protein [Kamptonema sp. UHCC 0994]